MAAEYFKILETRYLVKTPKTPYIASLQQLTTFSTEQYHTERDNYYPK